MRDTERKEEDMKIGQILGVYLGIQEKNKEAGVAGAGRTQGHSI